jgi:hypothetical protein
MQLVPFRTSSPSAGSNPRNRVLLGLLATTLLTWSHPLWAQTAEAFFPPATSGYDQELGVTVLSRLRPEYEAPGIQLGSFTVRPNLDESIFDNTNVNGGTSSGNNTGSWGSRTSATVSAQSDWSRDSLAATIGMDHFQFFDLPSENYTDWNVGLAGGYTIGDSQLTAAYSHQSYHLLGTALGAVQTETPSLNQTDSAELSYTFNFGRFSIAPTLDVSAYRYGDVTLNGIEQNQDYLNRDVVAGGFNGRYALTDKSGIIFVARAVDSHYISPAVGQPSNNSDSFLALGGLDYQAASVWRYSLLAGVETRVFQASQYASHTAPIVAATAIWTPTGVLTLTGVLSREIEDPESADTNGFVLSQARLVVDYELLRYVLLQGRGAFENANYLQGGSQNAITFGGGVTWLLNRNLQLSLSDDYTRQTSAGNISQSSAPNAQQTGAFNQNLLALTLHVGL